MSEQIAVDFGQLEGLAADIGSQASALQSTLDALKSRLTPAIAQWEGATSGAFQDVDRKWNESASGLQEVLAAIGIAVRSASEAFQAGERQNAARWGG